METSDEDVARCKREWIMHNGENTPVLLPGDVVLWARGGKVPRVRLGMVFSVVPKGQQADRYADKRRIHSTQRCENRTVRPYVSYLVYEIATGVRQSRRHGDDLNFPRPWHLVPCSDKEIAELVRRAFENTLTTPGSRGKGRLGDLTEQDLRKLLVQAEACKAQELARANGVKLSAVEASVTPDVVLSFPYPHELPVCDPVPVVDPTPAPAPVKVPTSNTEQPFQIYSLDCLFKPAPDYVGGATDAGMSSGNSVVSACALFDCVKGVTVATGKPCYLLEQLDRVGKVVVFTENSVLTLIALHNTAVCARVRAPAWSCSFFAALEAGVVFMDPLELVSCQNGTAFEQQRRRIRAVYRGTTARVRGLGMDDPNALIRAFGWAAKLAATSIPACRVRAGQCTRALC